MYKRKQVEKASKSTTKYFFRLWRGKGKMETMAATGFIRKKVLSERRDNDEDER